MPTVVFEINGRKYPLPPVAYTNQVRVWGEGAPAHPAPPTSHSR